MGNNLWLVNSHVKVLDPEVRVISFFNGFGGTVFGPKGNGAPGSSNITSFGGFSGYFGTQGAFSRFILGW